MMERLTRWIRSKEPRREYEWPDCEPPGQGCIAMGCNGVTFKKAEIAPGRWQWVEDDEMNRWSREYESRKRDLFWAMRTRVLSDDEMKEALSYGENLNIEPMVGYMKSEKFRELNEAYYQQARLRSLAAQPGDRTAASMREGME